MDHWILDNLQMLVPVVIAILYFIGSKAKKAEKERQAQDPKAGERARRIQEEIRRKILERQQQGRPVELESAPGPPPLAPERSVQPQQPYSTRADPARGATEAELFPGLETLVSTPAPNEQEDLLATQRRQIEEQMQKARELRKQEHSANRKRSTASYGRSKKRRIGDSRVNLRRELKNVSSIRRAIVLKEILDTPIALRGWR